MKSKYVFFSSNLMMPNFTHNLLRPHVALFLPFWLTGQHQDTTSQNFCRISGIVKFEFKPTLFSLCSLYSRYKNRYLQVFKCLQSSKFKHQKLIEYSGSLSQVSENTSKDLWVFSILPLLDFQVCSICQVTLIQRDIILRSVIESV